MSTTNFDLNNVETLKSDQHESNPKTTRVSLADKVFFESNNDIVKRKSFWQRNKRVIVCSIILFFILIFLARVPFIGSYVDAFVFDYLWGFTKYLIYIWLITLCFTTMFKPSFTRAMFHPKMIIMQLLISIGCSLTISAIMHWYKYSAFVAIEPKLNYFAATMKHYHTAHFAEYINVKNQMLFSYKGNHQIWWANTYYSENGTTLFFVSGGFVGEIFEGLGYLFIILFALSLFGFGLVSIIAARSPKAAIRIQKFNAKIFGNKKLKGKLNELGVERNDVKVKKVESDKIKFSTSGQDTPPIRFLTDTSIDNYQTNKEIASKVKNGIMEFNHLYQIKLDYLDTKITPLYTSLIFAFESEKDIQILLKNQIELSRLTKLSEFNVLYKGKTLRIEYPNKTPSKVSIKSVLSTNHINTNTGSLLIGITEEGSAIFYNLHKQPSILLIGAKGSGSAMLLSSMVLTYTYLNKPEAKIDIICKGDTAFSNCFRKVPHVDIVSKIDFATTNVDDLLNDIVDDIDRRLGTFKATEVDNFDDYNDYCRRVGANGMKRRILVFGDFDEMAKRNYGYVTLVEKILAKGQQCGIAIILTASSLIDEINEKKIYGNINTKIILRVATEDESMKIFENYRANQLYGNGDGYIFGASPKEKVRFQSCYLNQNELSKAADIVADFFKE